MKYHAVGPDGRRLAAMENFGTGLGYLPEPRQAIGKPWLRLAKTGGIPQPVNQLKGVDRR